MILRYLQKVYKTDKKQSLYWVSVTVCIVLTVTQRLVSEGHGL